MAKFLSSNGLPSRNIMVPKFELNSLNITSLEPTKQNSKVLKVFKLKNKITLFNNFSYQIG